MAAHPDLRVLCRKLTTTTPDDLLSLCPTLVQHVLRCGSSLSAPVEQKPKDGSNETAMLVHKLRTHITTLLNGKTSASRFAGMALVKAVVDVGGWECLRLTEPWVRGLLSMVQKSDPVSSKELCVVTLTRIYTLLHEYPTLVREIATTTIPTFAQVCLQLLKLSPLTKLPKAPLSLVETVVGALAVLVPLYPTTLRPFNGQIKGAIRIYLAPTSSDPTVVPQSLRQSARRLAFVLHHTAPKSTHSEEWASLVTSLINESHSTADQIFRAVQESWEPSSGYAHQQVSTDGDPHGGGQQPDDLPTWSGLDSGAQRLLGLLETLSEGTLAATKSTVTLPTAALTDLVGRILLVTAPVPTVGTHDRNATMQLNPSISREEKDELWSAIPGLHMAALQLLLSLVRRLGKNSLPLASSILDQAARVHVSSHQLSATRIATFTLVREVLLVAGPTLPRTSVDAIGPVIQSCCSDLLGAAGFAPDKGPAAHQTTSNGTRNGTAKGGAVSSVQANADLFLPGKEPAAGAQRQRSAARRDDVLVAAEALLETTLSHLPQQNVKKADRALMDRAAILSGSKAAMLAGVLHPYVDKSGRLFANTYPFLARQYPYDAGVELLRSNLRTNPHCFGNVFAAGRGEGAAADGDESMDEDEPVGEARVSAVTSFQRQAGFGGHSFGSAVSVATDAGAAVESVEMELDSLPTGSGEPPVKTDEAPFVPLILKRKSVDVEPDVPAKRQDKGQSVAKLPVYPAKAPASADASDSDDESVHLEMVLDDDEDEEDE